MGQLLIIVHKAHRATIANKLSAIGLYPGQDGLLYHLSLSDGLTMSELVEKLQIKHSTIFVMVERMAAAGLVKKEKDNLDRRSTRVFLTGKGKKIVEKLSYIWKEIEKELLQGFTKEEKRMAITNLKKLIYNLNKQ